MASLQERADDAEARARELNIEVQKREVERSRLDRYTLSCRLPMVFHVPLASSRGSCLASSRIACGSCLASSRSACDTCVSPQIRSNFRGLRICRHVCRECRQLHKDLDTERFLNREGENKDVLLEELRGDLANLEEENRKLTLQQIQHIWGGRVRGEAVEVPPYVADRAEQKGPATAAYPSTPGTPASSATSQPRGSASRTLHLPATPQLRTPSTGRGRVKGSPRRATSSGVGSGEWDADMTEEALIARVCQELWSKFSGDKPRLWMWLDRVGAPPDWW